MSASVDFDRRIYFMNDGIATEARMPRIATTIMSSMRVKPRWREKPRFKRAGRAPDGWFDFIGLTIMTPAPLGFQLLDVVGDVETGAARDVEVRIDRANALIRRVDRVA